MNRTTDSPSDLSPSAPIVRARRGRVTIDIAPVAVQTENAAHIIGISADSLFKIPFSVLPYRRNGSHRWYLVSLLQRLAEQLMAEQIAYGPPATRETFGQRVFSRDDTPVASPISPTLSEHP